MNRSLYGLTGCLVLLLALAMLLPAFAAKAPGPDVNRLASYLPADTHAYVEIPSVPAALEALAQHPFARLLEDEEVSAFGGFYVGLARGFIERLSVQWTGVGLKDLRSIFAGRVELAIPPLDDAPGEPFDSARRFLPASGALIVDVSGAEKRAREVVGRLIDHLIDAGHTVKVVDLGGRKVMVRPGRPEVYAFFARGRFFVATGRMLALRLVEGKPIEAPRLADDPCFRRSMERIRAAGSHVTLFGAWTDLLERVISIVRGGQSEEQRAAADAATKASGVMSMRGMAVGLRFDAGGVREITHLDIGDEPTGFARLAGASGTGLELPGRMSAGTLFYHGGRLDLARAWDVFRASHRLLAKAVDIPETRKFGAELDAVESGSLGFDLKKDLIDTLGDEYGIAAGLSPSGGVVPEVVAVVKVKDPERLNATLKILLARAAEEEGVRLTTGRLDETEFHVLRGVQAGITPSFAVKGDVFVYGLTIQSLKRFLRPSGPRLPAGKAYREALESVGLQDLETASFLSYVDLPKALVYGYNMGVPLLSMLDTDDLPFELDTAALPTGETLARGFRPLIVVNRATADAFTSDAVTPLPIGALVFASFVAGIIEQSTLEEAPAPERQ